MLCYKSLYCQDGILSHIDAKFLNIRLVQNYSIKQFSRGVENFLPKIKKKKIPAAIELYKKAYVFAFKFRSI